MRGPTHKHTRAHAHTHTHKGMRAITPHTLSYRSLSTFFGQTQGSSSPGKTSFPVRRRRAGREGVHSEKSAGNYGRRQFRSNQREIWGGLGWGLIGAGTRRCIHLSMRGLHQQSSPGQPNQSLLLTPLLSPLPPSFPSTLLSFPLFHLSPTPLLSRSPTFYTQVQSDGLIKSNLRRYNKRPVCCWRAHQQLMCSWADFQPMMCGPITTTTPFPLLPFFHFLSECVSMHMLDHTGSGRYVCKWWCGS